MSNKRKQQFDALVAAVDDYVEPGMVSVHLPNGFSVVRSWEEKHHEMMRARDRLDRERRRLADMASAIVHASRAVEKMLSDAIFIDEKGDR